MIQLTPQMRILVAVEPVDFRKGIDGLAGVCRKVLLSDPFNGYVFVLRNKRKTAIKCLYYDGQGFWLAQKRLSKGQFSWWPEGGGERPAETVEPYELQLMLWNGNPQFSRVAKMWRKLQKG
jgi:transposase